MQKKKGWEREWEQVWAVREVLGWEPGQGLGVAGLGAQGVPAVP